MVLVLNMSDMAERRGIQIDREVLARAGMPVLATVGVRGDGAQELLAMAGFSRRAGLVQPRVAAQEAVALDASPLDAQTGSSPIPGAPADGSGSARPRSQSARDDRIDAVVLHPRGGACCCWRPRCSVMFQAVFTGPQPTDWINVAWNGAPSSSTPRPMARCAACWWMARGGRGRVGVLPQSCCSCSSWRWRTRATCRAGLLGTA